MITRKKTLLGFLVMLAAFLAPFIALANKGSVKIEAPATAKKGEEVTIKLNVSHCCVTKMHYVNWAYLDINGAEKKKWAYSSKELPPAAEFSLSYKYKVEGDTKLKAEANCNIHGSSGPAMAEIKLAPDEMKEQPQGNPGY